MKSSELKAQARETLKGKWMRAVVLTIIYTLVTIILSYVLTLLGLVGSIINTIISPAISFGILVSYIKISRNEETTYFSFLEDGFSLLGKLWGIVGHTLLKMILPIVLVIVGAAAMTFGAIAGESVALLGMIVYVTALIYLIIKSLAYTLTSYILNDEPSLKAKEIVEKSEQLMKGNKGRYILFSLSFIGWSILAVITFGLGYFWLLPYVQIATLKFYEDLAGAPIVVESTVESSDDLS